MKDKFGQTGEIYATQSSTGALTVWYKKISSNKEQSASFCLTKNVKLKTGSISEINEFLKTLTETENVLEKLKEHFGLFDFSESDEIAFEDFDDEEKEQNTIEEFLRSIKLEIKEDDSRGKFRGVRNGKIIFRTKTEEEYHATLEALKETIEEEALEVVTEEHSGIPFIINKENKDALGMYYEICLKKNKSIEDGFLLINSELLDGLFNDAKFTSKSYRVPVEKVEEITKGSLSRELIKRIEKIGFTQDSYNEKIKNYYKISGKSLGTAVVGKASNGVLFLEDGTHKVIALKEMLDKVTFEGVYSANQVGIQEVIRKLKTLRVVNSKMILKEPVTSLNTIKNNLSLEEIHKEDLSSDLAEYLSGK